MYHGQSSLMKFVDIFFVPVQEHFMDDQVIGTKQQL